MNADELDQRIDALYALPPERFVAERDRLARELGGREHAEARSRVEALRKPSPAAWATNQLHRRARAHLDALWAAGEALQVAQESVLAGAGREAMTQAATRESAAIATLLADAQRLAGEAGQTLSEATLARTVTTLRTLARVPAARLGFRGQLARELEPAGVEALLAAGEGAQPGTRDASTKARAAARDEVREEAAERERRRRQAWTQQRRVVEQRQQHARRLEQELARLERDAEAARAHVAEAETALARAQAARDEAERSVQRARLACDTARTEAVVAERDLAALENVSS